MLFKYLVVTSGFIFHTCELALRFVTAVRFIQLYFICWILCRYFS